MKKLLHIGFFLLVPSLLIAQVPSTKTPDELSAAIINCLSAKNYSTYSDLLLTKEGAIKVINASSNEEARKNALLSKVDDTSKKIVAEGKRNFDRTVKDIEADGVIIANIKYSSCTPEIKTEKGNETMNLTIHFDFKGTDYTISCKGVVKVESIWKLTGGMNYEKINNKYSPAITSTSENASDGTPRKITATFYTDKGATAITEGDRGKLFETHDLLVKVSYGSEFKNFDKVIFWLDPQKESEKAGGYHYEWRVTYKKKDFVTGRDITLWLMNPESETEHKTFVDYSKADFMADWGTHGWVHISPKEIFGKRPTEFKGGKKTFKEDIIQHLVILGYMQTGTGTKEYVNSRGELIKETYPIYDNGSLIFETEDFRIKKNE